MPKRQRRVVLFLTREQFANETPLKMKEVRRRLLGEPSPKKVRRWIYSGIVHRATGKTIRLECFSLAGELMTTVEAHHRFLDRLNGKE